MQSLLHLLRLTACTACMLFCLTARYANSQTLRLTPPMAPAALYAETDQLINYSRYYRYRFDAALLFVYPNEGDRTLFENAKRQWRLHAQAGYATTTRACYASAQARLVTFGSRRITPHVEIWHDMRQAASTTMETYHMTQALASAGFVANRFVLADAAQSGIAWQLSDKHSADISLAYSIEHQCFDHSGASVLPHDKAYSQLPTLRLFEVRGLLQHAQISTLNMTIGHSETSGTYLRLLAQTTPTIRTGICHFQAYAQGGYASPDAPISRMFDLSGSMGSPFFFRHAFTTVLPNEYMASVFARATVTLHPTKALWSCPFSAPVPFAQISAMAGWLWDGHAMQSRACVHGMRFEAPADGLAEPAIGIDGLLQLGQLQIGCAAAFRADTKANNGQTRRWAFTVTALLKGM